MAKSMKYTDFEECLIGKKDRVFEYQSKWPIYRLSLLDKNGMWASFNQKMQELDNKGMLSLTSVEEIDDFFYKNPDIEFEMHVFEDIMQKHHFVKLNDKIWCYSTGKYTKNTKNIMYVRFFFDLKELFNC